MDEKPSYEELERRIALLESDSRLKNQTTLQLLDSEVSYRLILESISDTVIITDDLGNMIYVCPNTTNIFGFSQNEIYALQTIQKLLNGPVCSTAEIKNKGEIENLERSIKNSSGEVRLLLINAKSVKINNGTILYVMRDITDRKQAEKSMRASEKKYRNLFENMAQGVFYQTADGVLTDYNNAALEMFGLMPDQLMRKTSLDPQWKVISEDGTELPGDKHPSMVALQTGKPVRDAVVGVYNPRTKDIKWLLVYAIPQFNKAGEKPYQVFVTLQDITDQKKNERLLIEGRAKLKGALESMTDAVFISDADGNFVEFNEAFSTFHRLQSKKECLSALADFPNFLDVYSDDDKLLPLDLWVVSRALRGEQGVNEVFKLQRRDTGETWFGSYNFAPIYNNEGDITGSVVVAHDVTDKLKIQAQLTQAQKMEAIGTLAGGIAHDFNNILACVLGFTELALLDAEKETTIKKYLQGIYSAGLRAKDLVQQILMFARRSEETLKPIQVGLIINEILKFIRSSIPTNIEIKQDIKSNSLVMASSTQVHRIMMNLCANAAHAMEGEGGILEVKLKDISFSRTSIGKLSIKPGNYIEIKVSDTGHGIEPHIIEKIFEPYFTTKGPGEGTGMGLAMVHGIVETYGGKLLTKSKPGKGTVFIVYLPVARESKAHQPYKEKEISGGQERILFVDDEPDIAIIGSRMLDQLGYSVTTRTCGVEALELFRSKPNDFDLVISDVTMPKMTGDQLSKELIMIRSDIPIILCTGYSKRLSKKRASEIGIKAFTYKPIVKEDLAKTVREVLDEVKA